MIGSLTLVTAPPDEGPIDLDRFKSQARIDIDDEDALLTSYLQAATKYLDGSRGILGRALMTQTWDWRLDEWPGCLEVPLAPLQSVTSITYYDSADVSQTWSSSNYEVDPYATVGRIVPKPSATLPTLSTARRLNRITVRFVAGYGANPTDVPETLRHAISMLATHWYENRAPIEIGNYSALTVPMGFHALLANTPQVKPFG